MSPKFQCFYPGCGSRRCKTRITRQVDFEGHRKIVFDEVACREHVKDLEQYANLALGKGTVVRSHISSTENLMRGELIEEPNEVLG